ncbi:peptidoglycan-binding protein [Allorhizocola rhizosphaerae]|uniref:peptidoglycan-binding protein n=1 Tax=Allorhizocola rhizosphaerae TaxID=1872709 RepID=UPI000E3EC28C|nr:peptidoglycan-binding protein [Allorhizocola rhizosphaerae]
MKRRLFIAAGAVVALGGAGAAAVGFGGSQGAAPRRSTQPAKTADITRATLTDYEELDGELGYGEEIPLRLPGGQGIVTWLPPVGSTVDRGQPVFKVDNEPVVLLFGELPLYRALASDAEGPDVKQLEDNLRALGYTGFTVDEKFSGSTATAVKRWQEDLRLAESGVVAPGRVVYAGGPIRVAQHKLRVGDVASGEVIAFTGTVRKVIVNLPMDQQRYAAPELAVQVTLPDGKPVQGKVESVGTTASNGDGGQQQPGGGGDNGPATLEVAVSIADQAAIGTLQRGPVKVRFVAEERKDVLTVPVAALVALSEGGYGVQVVDGESARYIAVETGMFANGRVEIRGGGLQPGMKVGVPK